MEIGVRVEGEEMKSGEVRHIASAYLTFVALNEAGRPSPIPIYKPCGDTAKRRYEEAMQRREERQRSLSKRH
jgi:acyl-CoA hydrolase